MPGHWEGDLVVGADMSSCLVTLVERLSRFLLMSRLLSHDAETVEERLERTVSSMPDELNVGRVSRKEIPPQQPVPLRERPTSPSR